MIIRILSFIVSFLYLLIVCIPLGVFVYLMIELIYGLGMAKRFIKKRFL